MWAKKFSLNFHSQKFASQVFYNWKGQLRTRAKKLKQIQDGKTGVDDKLALQKLTDVEKRALKLWKEDFQDKDIASVSREISFYKTRSECAIAFEVEVREEKNFVFGYVRKW